MTIYRVYRQVYIRGNYEEGYSGFTLFETLGYYRTKEMAEYVANHHPKENEDVFGAVVEEIEVQNTCPVYDEK